MTKQALLLALAAIAQAQNTDGTTTTANTNTNANTNTAQRTTTAAATTTQGTQTAGETSLTDLPNLSTAASVGASTVSVTSAPDLTTTSIFHLSDIPTIAGYGIPTQIVPWTAGAPFMQTSKLPEGTVFIIVGAFLGTLGAAILLWRGMIAWSLHRSVTRSQLGTHHNESMLKLHKPPFAQSSAMNGSALSLDRLSTPAGKLSKQTHRNSGTAAPPNARNSSLFFSPTAGAGAHHVSPAAAMTAGNNRQSTYLPAGYYAASSTAPSAPSTTGLSSLNPMHPSNKGYRPQYDVSPPDSPALSPRKSRGSGYVPVGDTQSYLHLPGGAPAGQRAPSANLEDLFEHHGNGMSGDRR